MKRKISLFLILTIIVSVFIPLSSVSAYFGGYANGKNSTIMIPDIYYIGREHSSKVATPLITDDNETTGTLLPKDRMVMIDLGTDRTIDSYRLKSDAKSMRISFYDRDTGYLKAFAPTEFTGKLVPIPVPSYEPNTPPIVVKGVRFVTVTTTAGEDININELDFFYSKDLPTDPTPTDPTTPIDPDDSSVDQAILVVTMTNGLEKEYDLPMSDINSFLTWYDTRDSGSGPAKFAINKYSNNKGPFSKRTDYVIFDKILTFEVSEYKNK